MRKRYELSAIETRNPTRNPKEGINVGFSPDLYPENIGNPTNPAIKNAAVEKTASFGLNVCSIIYRQKVCKVIGTVYVGIFICEEIKRRKVHAEIRATLPLVNELTGKKFAIRFLYSAITAVVVLAHDTKFFAQKNLYLLIIN